MKFLKTGQDRKEEEMQKLFDQHAIEIKQTLSTKGWEHIERYLLSEKESHESFLKQMPKEAHYTLWAQGGWAQVAKLLDFLNSHR